MTALADYYCALPILSRTLDGALLRSGNLANTIRFNCQKVLTVAAKLRNAVLFRESLVWVAGCWTSWKPTKTKDRTLQKIAINAHNGIAEKVALVQVELISEMGAENDTTVVEAMSDASCSTLERYGTLVLPAYFRLLCQKQEERRKVCRDYIFSDKVEDLLGGVLKNNLVLYRGHDDSHFFCAVIDDEDLPWNPEEVDW
jgi:hypothetical protein